ncbi:MAG: hypothetical protein EXQ95_13600 [Alphaproteobacteria bacterium]|nr:hypothetical protein [Alphaproteobacteria bacterium]
MSAAAHLMGAQDALQRGDRQGAIRGAMAGLALAPDAVEAAFLLGLVWNPGWFVRALALASDHVGAAVNLAAAFDVAGQRGLGLRVLRRSIAQMPALPPSLVNAALLSPPAASRLWLGRAAAVAPDDAIIRINLAAILDRMDRAAAAATEHHRAVALAPGHPSATVNLALAAFAAHRIADAGCWHRRTLALDPLAADAMAGLGAVERAQDRSGLAWARRALGVQADHRAMLANISRGEFVVGNAPAAFVWARRAEAAAPADPAFGRAVLGLMQYLSWPEPSAVLAAHRRWARRHAIPEPRPGRRPMAGRPLRVGYVSAGLRRHPVGLFLLPLLERHDRARFEAVGYAAGGGADDISERLGAATTSWREVRGLDDAALADLVRADRIDILVDLDGHAAGSRLTVFARRPAPVQLTWLDYPGSTGTDCFDAALVDPYEVPAGAEQWYSEPAVRLAGGRLVYRPPERAPEIGEPKGGPVRLGCFNEPAKIGAEAIALWARILREVPAARLTLKGRSYGDADVRTRYLRIFAAAGADPARIDFSGWSAHEAMLGELGALDIVLDPLPFSGCLTSCEALWMGVPIVTLAGRRSVERQTAALLARVGLDDLIAGSADDYVAIAAALAGDPGRRRALRRGMRARLRASSLMDEAGFARAVEAAYLRLWSDAA